MHPDKIILALRTKRAELVESAVRAAASVEGNGRCVALLNQASGLDEAEKILLDCVRGERERDEDAGN